MTYLIDGHNLIPHVAGLSLDQLDDEDGLVALLVGFSIKQKLPNRGLFRSRAFEQ